MGKRALRSVLIKPAGPDCNLHCSYCFYRDKAAMFGRNSKHRMSSATLEAVVSQVMGQSPESIAISWQGGEPTLMGLPFYEDAVRLERKYGDGKTVGNAFQTNGLLIDDTVAPAIAGCRNIVPVISFEGFRHETDLRRGHGVYDRLLAACGRLKERGIFFGCSVTTTRENFMQVTGEAFVGQMIRGGMYDARINHYSVLRTIEDMFGLPHAGGSAEVKPVAGCWIGSSASR